MRVRMLLAGLAAGALLLAGPAAGSAAASEADPVPAAAGGLTTWQLSDHWMLTAPTTQATRYAAQVQPPIQPDGSSTWPAKRGTLPVQFTLAEQRVARPQFASIDAARPYSVATYTPPESQDLHVKELANLRADYAYPYTQGHVGGGSLRWQITVPWDDPANPTRSVFVYYGDAPNFTSETTGTNGSGVDLLTAPGLRFDTTQVGGTFYDDYHGMLDLVGPERVLRVSLVMDSYWFAGPQEIDLQGASVNGHAFGLDQVEPKVLNSQPTTRPAATLQVERDGTLLPADQVTSAQGDQGGHLRQIDGKYVYELRTAPLGPGHYRVFAVVDSTRAAEPGVFTLR